jgi:hypothetical protein
MTDTLRTVVDTVLVQAPDKLITIDYRIPLLMLILASIVGLIIGVASVKAEGR